MPSEQTALLTSNEGGAKKPNAIETLRASIRQLSTRIGSFVEEHTGSIGFLGSLSIAVNSLTGPAMLNLPATFGRSGIIPTIATILFVCVLSSLCALHLANTISKVDNNENYTREVEYSDLFGAFWGRKGFLVSQVLFYCCVTCLNISSIVDTTQVVDTFLGHWIPGGSIALSLQEEGRDNVEFLRWSYESCSKEELVEGDCLPFSNLDGLFFTAGNLLVTAIFMPLALMDLKENAAWQIVGFLVLIATSCQFIIEFLCWPGLDTSNVTFWGYDWDDLFGVILFNFALVLCLPALLYETEPTVNVATVIVGGGVLSSCLYILIGLLGSMTMPNVSENMLESMMSGNLGVRMELGASIFAFAIIGLGIPLFSVLTRLNLMGGEHALSRRYSELLSVYFPFGVSFFLHDRGQVTKLLSWGGIVFTSLVVFLMPLFLVLHEIREFGNEGSIDVYYGLIKGKAAEIISVRVLLVLTFIAIGLAVGGNFV